MKPMTVESVKAVLDSLLFNSELAPDYSDPDKWYWNAWNDEINTEALARRIVEAHSPIGPSEPFNTGVDGE